VLSLSIQREQIMRINPFNVGNPVTDEQFIGRERELRRVKHRILNQGQSTAIVGDPHIGKTSLLNYLAAPETRKELYNQKADALHFSLIDSYTLGSQFTWIQFWEKVLEPIRRKIEKFKTDQDLEKQYKICHENNFGLFTLQSFFKVLKKLNLRVVLLLDEFDILLHHPILNTAEFFGGLRHLACFYEGALSVVIASRTSVGDLNKTTQEFNPTGSPFFNIFPEITLGLLTKEEIRQLLSIGSNRFTKSDIKIINRLAGGHPFLLQAAAAAMWDAHEDKLERQKDRADYIIKQLYREYDLHFSESWRLWSPEMRIAFTAVAMAHKEHLLKNFRIQISTLTSELRFMGPELKKLEERGLIVENEKIKGNWSITSEIMLTWLADEIVKAIRDPISFNESLGVSYLPKRRKAAIDKFIKSCADLFKQGATIIIKALVSNIGTNL
jgi:hypothetical protein